MLVTKFNFGSDFSSDILEETYYYNMNTGTFKKFREENMKEKPYTVNVKGGKVTYHKDKTVIEMNMAGTPKDPIKVKVSDKQLVITKEAEEYFTFTFPKGHEYNLDGVAGKYENGLLTIVIPIKEETYKQVEIG